MRVPGSPPEGLTPAQLSEKSAREIGSALTPA
jgi:hypothetical protein